MQPWPLAANRRTVRLLLLALAAIWTAACAVSAARWIAEEERGALAEEQTAMKQQLDDVAERLESGFHEMANLAKVIALEPSVARLLEKLGADAALQAAPDLAAKNALLARDADVLEKCAYLQSVVENTAYLTSFITDAKGIYVAGNIRNSPGMLLGRDYGSRRYFTAAMANGSGMEFAVGWNRQVLSVFFSEAIRKGDRTLGVATMRQGIAFLSAQLSATNAEVLIVDDHGMVVAATQPRWLLRHFALSGLPQPTNPQHAYGAESVQDAGFRSDPAAPTRARIDERSWEWANRSLNAGSMTVWLLSPTPDMSATVRIGAITALLATISVLLLLALVDRSLGYTLTLRALAHHDHLTGLPNRNLLADRVTHALSRQPRQDDTVALLFIDLDRFKPINDTLGHKAGDKVLVEVAARLQRLIRASDTIARIGGDEFVVVLENTSRANVGVVAAKIVEKIALPMEIDGATCTVGASIGVAIAPDDGDTCEALLKAADVAMYRAKEAGRSRFAFHG